MIKTFNVELSEEEIITLKKMANLITDLSQAKEDAGESIFAVTNSEFKEIGTYIAEELPRLLQ